MLAKAFVRIRHFGFQYFGLVVWPSTWMSFASILILVAALAILSYRVGAQRCH
jgi:hypothetical protein